MYSWFSVKFWILHCKCICNLFQWTKQNFKFNKIHLQDKICKLWQVQTNSHTQKGELCQKHLARENSWSMKWKRFGGFAILNTLDFSIFDIWKGKKYLVKGINYVFPESSHPAASWRIGVFCKCRKVYFPTLPF